MFSLQSSLKRGLTYQDATNPTNILILNDTFNDVDNTLLQSHTPNSGGSWTKYTFSDGGDITISSNSISVPVDTTSTVGDIYYYSVAPTSKEYIITTTYTLGAASTGQSGTLGILARVDSAAASYYLVSIGKTRANTLTLSMIKSNSGTITSLTFDTTLTLDYGVQHKIEFIVSDLEKSVYLDGVKLLSSTDNTIPDAGYIGVSGNRADTGNVSDLRFLNVNARYL